MSFESAPQSIPARDPAAENPAAENPDANQRPNAIQRLEKGMWSKIRIPERYQKRLRRFFVSAAIVANFVNPTEAKGADVSTMNSDPARQEQANTAIEKDDIIAMPDTLPTTPFKTLIDQNLHSGYEQKIQNEFFAAMEKEEGENESTERVRDRLVNLNTHEIATTADDQLDAMRAALESGDQINSSHTEEFRTAIEPLVTNFQILMNRLNAHFIESVYRPSDKADHCIDVLAYFDGVENSGFDPEGGIEPGLTPEELLNTMRIRQRDYNNAQLRYDTYTHEQSANKLKVLMAINGMAQFDIDSLGTGPGYVLSDDLIAMADALKSIDAGTGSMGDVATLREGLGNFIEIYKIGIVDFDPVQSQEIERELWGQMNSAKMIYFENVYRFISSIQDLPNDEQFAFSNQIPQGFEAFVPNLNNDLDTALAIDAEMYHKILFKWVFINPDDPLKEAADELVKTKDEALDLIDTYSRQVDSLNVSSTYGEFREAADTLRLIFWSPIEIEKEQNKYNDAKRVANNFRQSARRIPASYDNEYAESGTITKRDIFPDLVNLLNVFDKYDAMLTRRAELKAESAVTRDALMSYRDKKMTTEQNIKDVINNGAPDLPVSGAGTEWGKGDALKDLQNEKEILPLVQKYITGLQELNQLESNIEETERAIEEYSGYIFEAAK